MTWTAVNKKLEGSVIIGILPHGLVLFPHRGSREGFQRTEVFIIQRGVTHFIWPSMLYRKYICHHNKNPKRIFAECQMQVRENVSDTIRLILKSSCDVMIVIPVFNTAGVHYLWYLCFIKLLQILNEHILNWWTRRARLPQAFSHLLVNQPIHNLI